MTRRKIFGYVGNRGIVLGTLGIIWMLSAIGIALEPVRPEGLLDSHIPIPVRFCLWFIPGFVAVLAMGLRKMDEWAWMFLILPVVIRFFVFIVGWVTGSYPPGWRGALVYAASVLLVNRCAAGLDRPAPWDGRDRRAWTAVRQ